MHGVDGKPRLGLFLQTYLVSLFIDAGFPVYLYEFEHHAPSGIIVKPRNDGADHGDEIRFIFGSPFSKGAKSLPGCSFSPCVYSDPPLQWLATGSKPVPSMGYSPK